MINEPKQHGGPGRNQGRKPLATNEDTVTFSIRMTATQRARLALLGGAAWVRLQIDKSKPNDSQPKGE